MRFQLVPISMTLNDL